MEQKASEMLERITYFPALENRGVTVYGVSLLVFGTAKPCGLNRLQS
jgi:hypothetical protein